jgi:hypothetical protein
MRVTGEPEVPEGWGQYTDQDNRRYYYNTLSGENSWEAPAVQLAPNWVVHKHPRTGKTLYVNTVTKAESEKPPRCVPV